MAISEFDIINHYFAKRTQSRGDVVFGIGDDCALLQPPTDKQLVTTVDTLVSGIHFPENTKPQDIGWKSLAVSLSDIAAMGANPAWVSLSITLPSADPNWISSFCDGFFDLLDQYHCQLITGDITHGPLSISTFVHGFITPNKAILRSTAKEGDLIYVTGTLGDSGLALDVLNGKPTLNEKDKKFVLEKLNKPQPRVEEGKLINDYANSGIDISDGLAQDLGHILEDSGKGALLNLDAIPLSDAVKNNVEKPKALEYALKSGDDYELCFTLSPEDKEAVEKLVHKFDCGCVCIGVIESQTGLRGQQADGKIIHITQEGYQHF